MELLVFENRLESLLGRWAEVEAAIKQAEYLEWQVTVPAINELRYAGRAIIRAVSLTRNVEDDQYDRSLILAEQYLTNAQHDIVDSIVVFIGSRAADLDFRFGRAAIEKLSPGYSEINSTINRCRSKIEISRKDSSQRMALYNELQTTEIPRLLELYEKLIASDAVMSVEMQSSKLEIERFKFQRILLVTISCGLLVGLASSIVVLVAR